MAAPARLRVDDTTPTVTRGPGPWVVEALRRRVGLTVRGILVGNAPPVRDFARPLAGDLGLFGPGSVTWRVHADAAMLVGGIRALMLQSLHPLAMAAVAEHSAFRTDPLGRLWNTSKYVGTVTFGTTAQAWEAADQVRRVHEHVHGVAPDGRPYSADDPALLSWVHHAMVDSFLSAHQRYGAERLDRPCADRYVAEMATFAELVGFDDAARSVEGLRSYLADVRPELHGTREAHEGMWFLAVFPVPLLARPSYGLLLAAAAGLLPRWARHELWLPVPPLTDPLLVRPAAARLTRFVGWALRPPVPSPRARNGDGTADQEAGGGT